jgi:hypothetical protein
MLHLDENRSHESGQENSDHASKNIDRPERYFPMEILYLESRQTSTLLRFEISNFRLHPEPCQVQGYGPESIVVQGYGPESIVVQGYSPEFIVVEGSHEPFVVHGRLRIEKNFWM